MKHPIVIKARTFAQQAHGAINHRRKYVDEPYAVHLEAVAAMVAEVSSEPELIAAAWLHDVVEDTTTTIDILEGEFGERIATLVAELTDISVPGDGDREARKSKDRAHVAGACAAAKTIKLADMINNTKTIATHDPDFAVVYMREKRLLLDVLTEGDTGLYAIANGIVQAYYET